MKRKKKISIVIPSFNSQRCIDACLQSLIRQRISQNYEIIVVESGNDATPEIIKRFPEVKLITLARRALPGEARNIGVKHALGEIIAFIDADCIAQEDWLETAIKEMGSYAVVGGSVGNANPQNLISKADYFLTFNEFFPTMPRRETKFMPTCNFFCKKSVFHEIGGFREDLAAGEDTIFSYEAAEKYRLLFEPGITISHNNRESMRSFVSHHLNFGKHSAKVRRELRLTGHIFTKYPLLSLLIPWVRTTRISLRMIRWNWRMIPDFIVSFPLIFLGVMIWSVGFMKISFKSKDYKRASLRDTDMEQFPDDSKQP